MPNATTPIDHINVEDLTIEDVKRAVEELELEDKNNTLPRKALRFVRRHQTTILSVAVVTAAYAFYVKKYADAEEVGIIDAIAE